MGKEPEVKSYGLKKSDIALLKFIYRQTSDLISVLLSQIASERFAYHVTERTQLDLDLDAGTLKLFEAPTEAPKTEVVKKAE